MNCIGVVGPSHGNQGSHGPWKSLSLKKKFVPGKPWDESPGIFFKLGWQ